MNAPPGAWPRALAGYHRSPWPGEDGGPERRQLPQRLAGDAWEATARWAEGLRRGGRLTVTHRAVAAATMLVLRDPGEVYLLHHGFGPGSTATVERVDPESLATLSTTPALPGGPFWPGGVAVHANGDLYVTYGRWCHRLAPDCTVLAACELPRARPYNSLVVLPGGLLVMKDLCSTMEQGHLAVGDGPANSELVVLEPDGLRIVDRLVLPEPSIARLSAHAGPGARDGEVVVVGDTRVWRARWDAAAGRLRLDAAWTEACGPYVRAAGQGFGWDPVLVDGAAWFLDDGAGTEGFAGTFRGTGVATEPLHLVRQVLGAPGATPVPAVLTEVCGEAGGIVANPPCVVEEAGVVVGYDSGNAVLVGRELQPDGSPGAELWRRRQATAGHLLRDHGGALLTYDHDLASGEHAVVLEARTGRELGRVATQSALQAVVFPAPAWDGGCYVTTMAGVSRVRIEE